MGSSPQVGGGRVVVVGGLHRPTHAASAFAHAAEPASASAPHPWKQMPRAVAPLQPPRHAFAWLTTPPAQLASPWPHVSTRAPSQEPGGGEGEHISRQLLRSRAQVLPDVANWLAHALTQADLPATPGVVRQACLHARRSTRAVWTHAFFWRPHPTRHCRAAVTRGAARLPSARTTMIANAFIARSPRAARSPRSCSRDANRRRGDGTSEEYVILAAAGEAETIGGPGRQRSRLLHVQDARRAEIAAHRAREHQILAGRPSRRVARRQDVIGADTKFEGSRRGPTGPGLCPRDPIPAHSTRIDLPLMPVATGLRWVASTIPASSKPDALSS